jgi:hypothetical protein
MNDPLSFHCISPPKPQTMLTFTLKGYLNLAIATLFAIPLTSCLGPHKINKWVDRHYQEEAPPEPARRKNEQITVISKIPDMGLPLSKTEKNTSHLLPLVFYWQYDYKNTCTLNPAIAVKNFTATVISYAGKGLKQKLNGNHLELTVEQVPRVFAVDDKGHLIWVIIYAFGWDILTVQPVPNDLVVSYRLLDGSNQELKKGTISIPDYDKGLTLKMFQSLRKMTWQYLTQYDDNIIAMSKKFVDKLVNE